MLYILLTVIVVILYLIYKEQKKGSSSFEKIKKNLLIDIEVAESLFLETCEKMEDFMYSGSKTHFENTKNNFTRLSERFKHDDEMYLKIANDYLNWLDFHSQSVYFDADVKEHEILWIKKEEIEKRFENLLGKDYADPLKALYPNMSEKNFLKLKKK